MSRRPSNPDAELPADEFGGKSTLSAFQDASGTTGEPTVSATQILSEIVDIQKRIQASELGVPLAARLIADRTQALTRADVAAVGIVDGDEIVYYSAASPGSKSPELRVALPASVSSDCIANGEVLQYSALAAGVNPANLKISTSGMKAFLAIPVRHQTKIVGVLELRFQSQGSLRQQDVQVGHLMAGLVSDAISRTAEVDSKRMLVLERATMLQALAQLKPQLERMAITPAVSGDPAVEMYASILPVAPDFGALPGSPDTVDTQSCSAASAIPVSPPPRVGSDDDSPWLDSKCRHCAQQISPEEFFCGSCGTARMEIAGESSADSQSRWASLWYRQQASEKLDRENLPATATLGQRSALEDNGAPSQPGDSFAKIADEFQFDPLPSALQEFADQFAEPDRPTSRSSINAPLNGVQGRNLMQATHPIFDEDLGTPQIHEPPTETPAPLPAPPTYPWTSATNARQWLESIQPAGARRAWFKQRWEGERANFYLGLSFLLLVIALSGWGTHTSSTQTPAPLPGRSAANKRTAKPELGLVDEWLVNLGLAEAPAPPVYHGNPNAKVWVDVHSAQYYCSDDDLYGKTHGGKYSTQIDAQRDHFEVAYRAPCD